MEARPWTHSYISAGLFTAGISAGLFAASFAFEGSVQFISVTQSCLTLCNPMDYSTRGLRVRHHLPEITQTNVH